MYIILCVSLHIIALFYILPIILFYYTVVFLYHSNELAGAALRFGHSLVGQRAFRVDDRKSVNEYDLQTNFFNNTMVYARGWLIYGFFQIGQFNEFPTMHYFGIPRHSVSDSFHDLDSVFREFLVENCIVAMLLTW